MGKSLSHFTTPDGFSVCDVIPNLATVNFTLAGDVPFCVDNENDAPVTLSVKFAEMTTFVSKVFQVGANPYLIKEIAANAVLTAGQIALLKYGY